MRRVELGTRSYPILVATSYEQLPKALARVVSSRHGWIVSHEALLARYGRQLLDPLQHAGWAMHTIIVPESERSKSFAVVQRVLGTLARQATMRVPVLFALGGGVIGDVTGLIAAVFRRGVPYVQLPTTLLAQVDSAIGGKVGIDLPQGKNLVGAFYQPRLVYSNLSLLATLPMRQRRTGIAEVIKYGIIADRPLFAFLEGRMADCLALKPRALRMMVERSSGAKARVVSRDERETGTRRVTLNFGHTLGHALETATAYRRWTHGEAIAIGMCAASQLSVLMGLCGEAPHARIVQLIRAAGLPTVARGVSRQAVRRALRYDKKFVRGRARWVLLKDIGRVVVREDVPQRLVEEMLAEYVTPGV